MATPDSLDDIDDLTSGGSGVGAGGPYGVNGGESG